MVLTRSDAYNLAMLTASNGSVKFTSTRTSEGVVVPTAVDPDARGSGSGSPRISVSGGK